MIETIKQRNEKLFMCAQSMNSANPQEFSKITIKISLYNSFTDYEIFWQKDEGKENYYSDDINKKFIYPITDVIMKEIQAFDSSRGQPWTHAHLGLSSTGEFTVSFAMIPKEDNHPWLFMKGKSELSEKEAAELICYTPEDLQKCIKKYRGTYDKNLRIEKYQIDMSEKSGNEDADYAVIYENIAKLMFSIQQPNTKTMFFYGQIFDDNASGEFAWDDNNDEFQTFFFKNLEYPHDVGNKIIDEAIALRNMALFNNEKWTHFMVTLTVEGNFHINFAYIPQENSCSGLYMQAISDLPLDTALQYSISKETWQNCVLKFVNTST